MDVNFKLVTSVDYKQPVQQTSNVHSYKFEVGCVWYVNGQKNTKSATIFLQKDQTIGDLKQLLEKETGVPASQQAIRVCPPNSYVAGEKYYGEKFNGMKLDAFELQKSNYDISMCNIDFLNTQSTKRHNLWDYVGNPDFYS